MNKRTTQTDVEFSFQEWLALTNHKAFKGVGGYRLIYADARLGIGNMVAIACQINRDGGIHRITSFLSPREFCSAVEFLKASLRVEEWLKALEPQK